MKILVDGDACPVKEILVEISKEFHLEVFIFIDTSHIYQDDYSTVIQVDKGRDSVDFALVSKACAGDLVVTQDYGVAALALAKGAKAVNQNGLIYTSSNMDKLLFERYLSQKARRSGNRGSHFSKRTNAEDLAFEKAFRSLIASEGL